MAQPALHLIIGNYNTSSWSLRAWLALRLAKLAFDETRVPLRLPTTPGHIAEFSPSGKLPVLLAEGVPIWDSLAIAEFVAELEPGIWPLDPIARAEARSVAAEMHSGFAELRRLMPMDVVSRFAMPGRLPRGLAADIARIKSIWQHCRSRSAKDGPFLFGAFSVADAMMAPVATRFVTHGVPLDGVVEDYVDSVMSWPDMVTWCDAASVEQAERSEAGVLAVRRLSREGRTPGAEPAAAGESASVAIRAPAGTELLEQAAAPRAPEVTLTSAAATSATAMATGESTEPDPVAEVAPPSTTPPPMASADPSRTALPGTLPAATALTDAEPVADSLAADSGERNAASIPGAGPAATQDEAAAANPRKRLFESAPATPPAPPPAEQPATATATAKDSATPPVAEASPSAGGGISRGMAKLGWIRRPVPTDAVADTAPTGDRQLRRPTADLPPKPHAEATDQGEAAAGTAMSQGSSHQPRETARDARQAHPIGSAIKPIGGGILRRR
jgi:glutathione S-transferase